MVPTAIPDAADPTPRQPDCPPRRRLWRLTALAAGLVAATLSGCAEEADPDACGIPHTTASPGAGLYPVNEDTRITLRTDRTATIYFTLDGTVPDTQTANCRQGPTFCGDSPVSNIPIAYDGMLLQYFAVDRCGNQENIQQAGYRLDEAPFTTAEPEPGLYNTPVTVSLVASDEATRPATVLYTRDGTTPDLTNPSTVSGPSPIRDIVLTNSAQLKWKAIDVSGNQETVRSGQYTIDTVPPISSVDPEGGNYNEAVEVDLRIENDTGTLYYTTNGAVPRKDDPQGHTQVASLQTTLTLNESTYLRWTSIDKAGNREHPTGEYHEAVYVIADVPAIIATPPGGQYAETELDVVLSATPAEADISYSLNGSASQGYTRGDTIAITGFEVVLDAQADVVADVIQPGTISETYTLGVGGDSETFVEDFSTTDNIDTDATTARIDTDAGLALLGNVPVEREAQIDETDVAQNVDPLFPYQKRIAASPDLAGLGSSGTVVALDGTFAGAGQDTTGPDAPGLKTYRWTTGGNPPEPVFSGTFANTGAQPTFTSLALIRPNALSGTLIAAATSNGGQLFFVDTLTPTTEYDSVGFTSVRVGSTSPPALVAQTDQVASNALFGTRRPANGDNEIVAFTIDTGDDEVDERGTITPTTGLADEILNLAIHPDDSNRVLGLSADCELWDMDFSDLDSPTVANDPVATGLCPGTAVATEMLVFTAAGVDYAAVAYTTTGGDTNVSLTAFVDAPDSPVLGILAPDGAPSGAANNVWSMARLHAGTGDEVLAIASGSALWFYDVSNPSGILAGTAASLIQQRTDPDGFQLDGLAPFDATGVDFLFTNGWVATDGGAGQLGVWRVPQDLRDKQSSAVVQSTDINAGFGGNSVRSLKFEDNDFSGSIDFEFSSDGSNFESIECCQTKAVDPPSSTIYWRATLDDSEGDDVELSRVEFRLDYEEEEE